MEEEWSISRFYEKGWQVIKKYKIPWIFGLAVAGISLGNPNFYSQDAESAKEFFNNVNFTFNSPTSQILGVSTGLNFFTELFSLIPVYFYIILTIEIFIIIIFFFLFTLVNNAWSQAALLFSVQTALEEISPTIRESSENAFPSIKPLIWLQIIPPLILTIFFLILFGVLIIGIAFSPIFLQILFGILFIGTIFLTFYVVFYLYMTLIWASREVIYNHKNGLEALKSGYSLVKDRFWKMVLLGLVNIIFTSVFLLTPLILIIGIFLTASSIFSNNQSLAPFLVIPGAIFFFIFILGYILLSGILTAFKTAVWSEAYNTIKS